MIFSFSSNISEMDHLFQVIDSFCAIYGISDTTICKLKIIIDEVVSNVINYSCKDTKISISITKKNRDIKIKVVDTGNKFNPLLVSDPDISLSLEERKIGGLGIFLVKEYAKTIHYKRKQTKNVLTIILKAR